MKKGLIFIMLFFLIMLTGCNNNQKNETFKNLIEKHEIEKSTVLIIKEEVVSQGNGVNAISYTNGFSGVIFDKDKSKYLILTSYHTIESFEGNLYVLLWNVPRYNDLDNKDKKGIEPYYESKPKANIEYTNIKYDLAILSFSLDDELPLVELADSNPEYGTEIAVISNPENRERNYLSFGKITTKKPVPFGDDKDKDQVNIIEHSAYVGSGSSGSVLLNNDLKIVGINLGGSTNLFGSFKKGKAMPVNRIVEFVDLYNKQ